MTEQDFNKEVDKGIHSLTKLAHLASDVQDNTVIASAGKVYIKEQAGMTLRFCDALKGQNVKMD
jgi:hypothetical protein